MRYLTSLCAVFAGLAACSGRNSVLHVMSAENDVIPVCALPSVPDSMDHQKVRVRGRMLVGAHEIFLTDQRCSDVLLFLERAANGPDISLCSSAELVEQFGCPGGNDNGPVVTAAGVLQKSRSPQVATMQVEEMTDFQNVRALQTN
jgi:hypothetical protein